MANKHDVNSQNSPVQVAPNWSRLSRYEVVRKMRSRDHGEVLQAIEELRSRGCLSRGTLAWVCLRYADLHGANLSTANLTNADLSKANLEYADLSYAHLNGTRLTRAQMDSVNFHQATLDAANLVGANMSGALNLTDEQLSQAGRMRASILPDGKPYDGRFNLQGDLADASILHVDLNSPDAIAAFYGVSLEDFLAGQEWRKRHMPSISTWNERLSFKNAELVMKWR